MRKSEKDKAIETQFCDNFQLHEFQGLSKYAVHAISWNGETNFTFHYSTLITFSYFHKFPWLISFSLDFSLKNII